MKRVLIVNLAVHVAGITKGMGRTRAAYVLVLGLREPT